MQSAQSHATKKGEDGVKWEHKEGGWRRVADGRSDSEDDDSEVTIENHSPRSDATPPFKSPFDFPSTPSYSGTPRYAYREPTTFPSSVHQCTVCGSAAGISSGSQPPPLLPRHEPVDPSHALPKVVRMGPCEGGPNMPLLGKAAANKAKKMKKERAAVAKGEPTRREIRARRFS